MWASFHVFVSHLYGGHPSLLLHLPGRIMALFWCGGDSGVFDLRWISRKCWFKEMHAHSGLLMKSSSCNGFKRRGASLVAQRWIICLSVQEAQFWSLVREDPTCCRAAKPVPHSDWACALEPRNCDCWAHVPQRLEPARPWVCPVQQEKPLQWEARTPRAESCRPLLEAAREKPVQQCRPSTAKID